VETGATCAPFDDPQARYIPWMDWADNSSEILVQHLNRLQNTNTVQLGMADTGQVSQVFVEHDKTWVDPYPGVDWLDGGKRFTWLSERDGWKHAYAVSRSGEQKLLTPGSFHVIDVAGMGEPGGRLRCYASSGKPRQQCV